MDFIFLSFGFFLGEKTKSGKDLYQVNLGFQATKHNMQFN